jgi:hypothetical protein
VPPLECRRRSRVAPGCMVDWPRHMWPRPGGAVSCQARVRDDMPQSCRVNSALNNAVTTRGASWRDSRRVPYRALRLLRRRVVTGGDSLITSAARVAAPTAPRVDRRPTARVEKTLHKADILSTTTKHEIARSGASRFWRRASVTAEAGATELPRSQPRGSDYACSNRFGATRPRMPKYRSASILPGVMYR